MDQYQENPFLDNEKAFLKQYDEVMNESGFDFDKEVTSAIETDKTVHEQQVYFSFVKEEQAIIRYVYNQIKHSATLHEIDLAQIFQSESQKKKNAALTDVTQGEKELLNFKNRLTYIFYKYSEQPTILDPIVCDIVEPCMRLVQAFVKKTSKIQDHRVPPEISYVFEIIYNLCSVRGYKTIIKFFPHEVADLEPCVELLHFFTSTEYWVPCVLSLWLSIIVIVPFDIDTIDSKKEGDSLEVLAKRIINIGKEQLSSSGKLREFTSIMLSKLLTRPDVLKSGETDNFLKDIIETFAKCKEDPAQMNLLSGILGTLVEIFKIGHREDFLSRIDLIFAPVLQHEVQDKFMKKSLVLRKNRVKLAQRIGCIFLKPRIASWRYQRGQRDLSHLLPAQDQQNQENQQEDEEMLEEDDINFEQLEYIIQLLLDSLKDEDGVVRWSAAKGLGRITQRLTKDFGDQIVEQLTDLFTDQETESSWHGGCLALAELCRRGLLLPERLSVFVPILDKALIYEVNRGNHSVGAHVRDSACYVVWSFARAYAPDIMKPHVATLSTKLIIASLFDREVNCRRAASATFQECVGRQGNYPHGIEILTEADYFTLSNRVNAFLNVSSFVAQFGEYFESMVDHLTFVKLRHNDIAIRVLASQALSVICIFNPSLTIEKALTPLIEKCYSKALHIRHGAIYGVGEILIGLSGNSVINRKDVLEKAFKALSLKERKIIADSENQKEFKGRYDALSSQDSIKELIKDDSKLMDKLIDIIPQIESNKLCKGKGAEIIRIGVCHLIHSMCLAKLPFSEQTLELFFSTLLENLKHPNLLIQEEATLGLQTLCESYYSDESKVESYKSAKITLELQKMIEPSSKDANIALRKGFNMAFGVLSKPLIDCLFGQLVDTFTQNCLIQGNDTDDAETRKQAVTSLYEIIKRMGANNVSSGTYLRVIGALTQAMEDYAVDRRGDVGSWVREEAMICLRRLVHDILATKNSQLIGEIGADKPEFFEKMIGQYLQQLNEKIDRVREVAGRCLQFFFKFTLPLVETDFSLRNELLCLFISEESDADAQNTKVHDEGIAYLPWRSAKFVFQSIRPFFDSEVYSESIIKGLITCSGGLSESTLKASQNSLFEYLTQISKVKAEDGSVDTKLGIEKKKHFVQKFIGIFKNCQKQDRVTVPLMKTIEMLLSADYLSDPELEPQMLEIHTVTVSECNKSKNIVKLIAGVGLFAGMLNLPSEELQKKAIKTLLFLLFHTFPKVRQMTAESLYTGLLTLEEYEHLLPGGEDAFEEINTILSETDWANGDAKELTSTHKARAYELFGHEWVAPKKK